jgi:hypothetical protein
VQENMRAFYIVCFSAATFLAGCQAPEPQAPAAQSQFRIITGTHEVMEGLVAPAAEIVFKSVGYRATQEGGIQDIMPESDEAWEVVEHAALGLAESGNLLLLEGRAVDQADWVKITHDMMDTSVVAAKAAEAHDVQGVLEAGEKIYEACTACHDKYITDTEQ